MKVSPWLAFAGLCLALLTSGGAATAQTATSSGGGAIPLPSITVDAPKHIPRRQNPKLRVAGRSTTTRRSSPATGRPSRAPETSTVGSIVSGSGSVLTKLAKLERISGSCVGGCVTSFRTGSAPWRGCSGSAWPAYSTTCRNVYNFKTYNECTDAALLLGWQTRELTWYCSSLALK
jgi:hypothetical protein